MHDDDLAHRPFDAVRGQIWRDDYPSIFVLWLCRMGEGNQVHFFQARLDARSHRVIQGRVRKIPGARRTIHPVFPLGWGSTHHDRRVSATGARSRHPQGVQRGTGAFSSGSSLQSKTEHRKTTKHVLPNGQSSLSNKKIKQQWMGDTESRRFSSLERRDISSNNDWGKFAFLLRERLVFFLKTQWKSCEFLSHWSRNCTLTQI